MNSLQHKKMHSLYRLVLSLPPEAVPRNVLSLSQYGTVLVLASECYSLRRARCSRSTRYVHSKSESCGSASVRDQ